MDLRPAQPKASAAEEAAALDYLVEPPEEGGEERIEHRQQEDGRDVPSKAGTHPDERHQTDSIAQEIAPTTGTNAGMPLPYSNVEAPPQPGVQDFAEASTAEIHAIIPSRASKRQKISPEDGQAKRVRQRGKREEPDRAKARKMDISPLPLRLLIRSAVYEDITVVVARDANISQLKRAIEEQSNGRLKESFSPTLLFGKTPLNKDALTLKQVGIVQDDTVVGFLARDTRALIESAGLQRFHDLQNVAPTPTTIVRPSPTGEAAARALVGLGNAMADGFSSYVSTTPVAQPPPVARPAPSRRAQSTAGAKRKLKDGPSTFTLPPSVLSGPQLDPSQLPPGYCQVSAAELLMRGLAAASKAPGSRPAKRRSPSVPSSRSTPPQQQQVSATPPQADSPPQALNPPASEPLQGAPESAVPQTSAEHDPASQPSTDLNPISEPATDVLHGPEHPADPISAALTALTSIGDEPNSTAAPLPDPDASAADVSELHAAAAPPSPAHIPAPPVEASTPEPSTAAEPNLPPPAAPTVGPPPEETPGPAPLSSETPAPRSLPATPAAEPSTPTAAPVAVPPPHTPASAPPLPKTDPQTGPHPAIADDDDDWEARARAAAMRGNAPAARAGYELVKMERPADSLLGQDDGEWDKAAQQLALRGNHWLQPEAGSSTRYVAMRPSATTGPFPPETIVTPPQPDQSVGAPVHESSEAAAASMQRGSETPPAVSPDQAPAPSDLTPAPYSAANEAQTPPVDHPGMQNPEELGQDPYGTPYPGQDFETPGSANGFGTPGGEGGVEAGGRMVHDGQQWQLALSEPSPEKALKQKHPTGDQRRARRLFTVGEVEALVTAVERLGTGRWRDVKQRAFPLARHRTYADLKDKWKTLVRTARIAPSQRRGVEVPEDLLERVTRAHAFWRRQAEFDEHYAAQYAALPGGEHGEAPYPQEVHMMPPYPGQDPPPPLVEEVQGNPSDEGQEPGNDHSMHVSSPPPEQPHVLDALGNALGSGGGQDASNMGPLGLGYAPHTGSGFSDIEGGGEIHDIQQRTSCHEDGPRQGAGGGMATFRIQGMVSATDHEGGAKTTSAEGGIVAETIGVVVAQADLKESVATLHTKPYVPSPGVESLRAAYERQVSLDLM